MTLIFRLLTKAGDTYSLIFTSNLLWTVSTLTVMLVSLQIELVECIFIPIFTHIFISDRYFPLELNLDSSCNWFTGHFKSNLLRVFDHFSPFGNLFWLWRGNAEIQWFGHLPTMQLVSLFTENKTRRYIHHHWITTFGSIQNVWQFDSITGDVQKGNTHWN